MLERDTEDETEDSAIHSLHSQGEFCPGSEVEEHTAAPSNCRPAPVYNQTGPDQVLGSQVDDTSSLMP